MSRQGPDPLEWANHLAAVAGSGMRGPECPEEPPAALLRAAREGFAPERTLWESACTGGAALAAGTLDLAGVGPLWPADRWSAIEVWTESELCGLHALARLRRTRPELAAPAAARIRSAIEWHLEHTQPDNATHRPWGLHLFLAHPDPEVDLYGQTLLHNFEAAGRGDRDAAWILLDAAREIRLDPAVARRW